MYHQDDENVMWHDNRRPEVARRLRRTRQFVGRLDDNSRWHTVMTTTAGCLVGFCPDKHWTGNVLRGLDIGVRTECVYVHVCANVCVCVCVCVCVSVSQSVCLSVCIYACIYVSLCLSVCLSICLSVYVCVSQCMRARVCMCSILLLGIGTEDPHSQSSTAA